LDALSRQLLSVSKNKPAAIFSVCARPNYETTIADSLGKVVLTIRFGKDKLELLNQDGVAVALPGIMLVDGFPQKHTLAVAFSLAA